MPTTYYFNDFGFDTNAIPFRRPEAPSPLFYLQWGASHNSIDSPEGATPGPLTELHPGDVMRFYIYDLTDLGGTESPANTAPSLPDGWLDVAVANTNTAPNTNPFSGMELNVLNQGGVRIESVGSRMSPYFGGPYPAWKVVMPTGQELAPTVTNPNPRRPNDLPPFPARYRITFYLNVQRPDGTLMRFRHDPEMIVTPGG
ncbi:MAG TPA: hypothetical protein VND45_16190 [Thermoanaerobaculia bacterium]|jgi:hypothetical protein|nr:hypothetical protein [Thermoanaerobaculia bacterium]